MTTLIQDLQTLADLLNAGGRTPALVEKVRRIYAKAKSERHQLIDMRTEEYEKNMYSLLYKQNHELDDPELDRKHLLDSAELLLEKLINGPTPSAEEFTRLAEQLGKKANAPSAKTKGRPPDSDPQKDRRIAEAWGAKTYKTYADLARERDLTERDVRLALDRHRKREERKQ